MNRFPGMLRAGFLARWRKDRQKGSGKVEGSERFERAPRPRGARRSLAVTSGLLGAVGLVAGVMQAATSLPAAASASYVVNSLNPLAGSIPLCASGGTCGLVEAIDAYNTDSTGTDTITFAAALSGGTISLAAPLPTLHNTLVPLTIGNSSGGASNITINGGGNQVFSVLANTLTVTLQNLTITDATAAGAPGGGAIYTDSLLVLNTVTVENSSDGGHAGAGIYVDTSGNVTATNLTVTGNNATGGDPGGGIYNAGTFNSLAGTTPLTVTNNDTTAGVGSYGGGIYNAAGATFNTAGLVVSGNGNTTFGHNGGGIDNNGTFTITGTSASITNNTVDTGDGGGLCNESGGTFTSTATAMTITGNTSIGSMGGGVANEAAALGLTLSNATIADNSAGGDGGGIFNAGAALSVTNSTIGGSSSASANTAGEGGGFANLYTGTIVPVFSGVSITFDSALGPGGGIYDGSHYGLVFTLGSVSNNSAGAVGGGADILTGATGEDTFLGTAINNNRSTGSGGGINLATGGLNIGLSGTTTPSLSGNTAGTPAAGSDGGGLFTGSATGVTCSNSAVQPTPPVPSVVGTFVCIDSATISGNTAYGTAPATGGAGGGIDNNGSTVLLSRSTVSSNSAYAAGGGIAQTSPAAGMEILDTTVGGPSASNQLKSGFANQLGAGVYAAGGMDIYYSTIDYNLVNATANGVGMGAGLYFDTPGTYQMTDDTITQNFGSTDGGGIFSAATLGLNNDTIAFNTASNPTTVPGPGAGGGLFVKSGTVNTTGTIYTGDTVGNNAVGIAQNECTNTGTLHSTGYNLDQGASCGFSSALGDKSGGNANLGTFAVNGGIAGTANYALVSPSDALGTMLAGCPTYGQNASSNSQTVPTPCNIGSYQGTTVSPILTTTSTTVSPSPGSTSPGSSVTYTTSVTNTSAGTTPTGNVIVSIGGITQCTIILPTTSCSSTTAPSGTDTVTATYSGDLTHSGSAGTATLVVSGVLSATTTSVGVSPSSVPLGTSVIYSVTVSGGTTPTGTVTVTAGGLAICTITLVSGTGSCTSSAAPAGTDSVVATYGGDTVHSGSSGSTTLVVTSSLTATVTTIGVSPSSVSSGQSVIYTVTVSGGTTPTGTVTVIAGGVGICTITLSGGAGSCSSAAAPVGTDTVSGTYSGDSTHASSAGTTVLTVSAPSAHGPCVTAGYSGNSAFICQMYLDLLGRFPDSAGLATWLGQLAAGVSRTQVANVIDTSTEYRTDYINADYEGWLGRPVDPGGLATWLGQFAAGATEEQVDAGILGSNEFFADSGSNNTGFLDNLYQALLGRSPDPSGFATFSAQLASGVSRSTVALEIDTSHEQHVDDVTFFYSLFLNRAPDPGGLLTWVSLMDSGTSDEVVVASIIGSNEFYNLANR